MSDPVNLGAVRAEREDDNSLWTVADCLEEALREVRSGERVANKVVVLFLDTDGSNYDTGWTAANLRSSEMIGLLEVTKARLISAMGLD